MRQQNDRYRQAEQEGIWKKVMVILGLTVAEFNLVQGRKKIIGCTSFTVLPGEKQGAGFQGRGRKISGGPLS